MNAIYTILLGDAYITLGELLLKSIRKSGFTGDVIPISEVDELCDYECVNVNKFEYEFKYINAQNLFHNKNDTNFDYLLMRLRPDLLFDITKYDNIMYLDADCLVFKDPKIIFDSMKPGKFYLMPDIRPKVWRHLGKLTYIKSEDSKQINAMNSGVFAYNPKYTSFIDRWAVTYLNYREMEPRLQPSLNITCIENPDLYDVMPHVGGRDKKNDEAIVHYIPWRYKTTLEKMRKAL